MARRRPFLLLCLSWLLVAPLQAAEPGPREVVAGAVTRLQAAIRADHERLSMEPARLVRLVDAIAMPHVEVERLTRGIAGKYWRRLEEGARRALVAGVSRRLARVYGGVLLRYPDIPLEFPAHQVRVADGHATVTMLAWLTPLAPLPLEFRLVHTARGWCAYDLSVLAFDLITIQRGAFAQEVQRSGLEATLAAWSR